MASSEERQGVGFWEDRPSQRARTARGKSGTHANGRCGRLNSSESIKRVRAKLTFVVARWTALKARPVLRLVLLLWPRGRQLGQLQTQTRRGQRESLSRLRHVVLAAAAAEDDHLVARVVECSSVHLAHPARPKRWLVFIRLCFWRSVCSPRRRACPPRCASPRRPNNRRGRVVPMPALRGRRNDGRLRRVIRGGRSRRGRVRRRLGERVVLLTNGGRGRVVLAAVASRLRGLFGGRVGESGLCVCL